MAFPESLWLSATSLERVDDDNRRAFVIEKAKHPHPEDQLGSKRLIVDTMASVGTNTDVDDIAYAPAPGDTRSGFVTVHLVANSTEQAQLNAKKVWSSYPMGRSEAVALPEIGIFTIGGVTHSEITRLPFGGSAYQIGTFVRGVNLVENRLNEERLYYVQQELVHPMVVQLVEKFTVFETGRQTENESIAGDSTKTADERAIARAKAVSAEAKIEALRLIGSNIDTHFQTLIKPLNPTRTIEITGRSSDLPELRGASAQHKRKVRKRITENVRRRGLRVVGGVG